MSVQDTASAVSDVTEVELIDPEEYVRIYKASLPVRDAAKYNIGDYDVELVARDMCRVINTQLPAEETANYRRAVKAVPHLIIEEARPWWHYKCEDFNVNKAAQNTVATWNLRCMLYEDRAHLPMHPLDGTGTLTSYDISIMSSGAMVKVPDEHGRCITVIDESLKKVENYDMYKTARNRVIFYYCAYVAPQSPRAQEVDGVVNFRIVGDNDSISTGVHNTSHLLRAIPIKFAPTHLCFVSKLAQTRKYQLEIIGPFTTIIRRNWGPVEPLVFIGTTPQDVVSQVLKVGTFNPEFLPESIGGGWSYRKHDAWLQHRSRIRQAAVPADASALARQRMKDRKLIKAKIDRVFKNMSSMSV